VRSKPHEPQALKFLSSELSHDEAFTARFLREVRTLRQIRNRNVVDCSDLEAAEDGSLFFSMEFVDGPDLRTFLHNSSHYLNTDCHPDRPLTMSDAKGKGESKDLRLLFRYRRFPGSKNGTCGTLRLPHHICMQKIISIRPVPSRFLYAFS
jgi:hypothetical protein